MELLLEAGAEAVEVFGDFEIGDLSTHRGI
jgi:hypothetical protein